MPARWTPRSPVVRTLAHATAIAAAVAVAGACKTETIDDKSAVGSKPAAGGEAPDKIGAECKSKDAIDPATAAAIEGQARAVVEQVRSGKVEEIWDLLHPQARRDDQRQPFVDALRTMQARLEHTQGTPDLEGMYLVDVRGGVNDLARIECGATDDPLRFEMIANAGDEDVAVVMLLGRGQAFGHASTLQLRKRGNAWRLVGIQVNPATYKDNNAVGWETIGDQHARANKPVAAFLAYGVAQTLSSRGTAIKTAAKDRINEKLKKAGSDQLFAAKTDAWMIGDERFELHGVRLASTQSDISPVFRYVTHAGLVPELLDPEAAKLEGYVRSELPEVAELFDAVVFEAYAEAPTEKNKEYDAYRVARHLRSNAQPG